MRHFEHAVIMAAGRGIRLRPLTDAMPKAMAPLRGSTLIALGIEQLRPVVDQIHVTVGYRRAMLAEHVMTHGAASAINTEGHGNGWWVFQTLLGSISSPVLVLTCDNVTELDSEFLLSEYARVGDPACMLVPVKPVEGLDGDYLRLAGDVVTHLNRQSPTDIYCSGIQVLSPQAIGRQMGTVETFEEIWAQLMSTGDLKASRVYPKPWYAIDNLKHLQDADVLSVSPQLTGVEAHEPPGGSESSR